MYANGSDLIINSSALHASGYSISSLKCCYHTIERVEQSLKHYNEDADFVVKFSSGCIPIRGTRHQINAEFIRVYCISTSAPLFLDVVYRDYFTFAQLDSYALKKVVKWEKLREKKQTNGDTTTTDIPPNILLLGVDSNSRLNSHRRLTKTLKTLSELGAIEMFGYTKVGENTFPNTVAFLTGLHVSVMQELCYSNDSKAQDGCPYIWKDFDKAGYLTATVEDAPHGTGFNYLKTGFVLKPTDFYFRPFMLAVMMNQPRESLWFLKCLGRYYISEVVLNYISDILKRGRRTAPVFIHSWLTTMTHECSNGARFLDNPLTEFIRHLESISNNTILIFMSDHGDRYGNFRSTNQGSYEDKLPTMWIYLPPMVKQKFPRWESALKINSRRLSSHYDLFQSLAHILTAYDKEAIIGKTNKTNGLSLFEPLPENRTCNDAAIPIPYCACTEPTILDVNCKDPKVQAQLEDAANVFIKYLNDQLPNVCESQAVKEIASAKVVKSPLGKNALVVSVYTEPGDFLFEVSLRESNNATLELNSLEEDVLRMNKMTRKATCVSSPILERYCFCK